MSKNDYSAENISVLKGLEAVRLRPGMYIGPTNEQGLHHMLWEIVDNSIDEFLAGHVSTIEISLNPDGFITIKDNGRGIPVGIHPVEKVSALQLAATVLHAGGKFNNDTYRVSTGLHGVGLSVVNALSSDAKIQVFQNSKEHIQEYREGKPLYPVKEVGKSKERGTWVTFKPDATILETIDFNLKTILRRIRQSAYLNGGLTFKVSDLREEAKPFFYTFHFEGGIKSYLRHINSSLKTIHKNIYFANSVKDEISVDIALQYTDDIQSREIYFGNNVMNKDGGTHATGFRTALTKTLNDYLPKYVTEKEKDIKLSGDDVREGLSAIVAVKVMNPIFENQTKTKLNNPEVANIVRKVVEDTLKQFLDEHPEDAKAIVGRAVLSSRARAAPKAARAAGLP
jgi:DNA gyrase subunit B